MNYKEIKRSLIIVECQHQCPDCERGEESGDYGSHNPFHLPHFCAEFVFNASEKEALEMFRPYYEAVHVSETYDAVEVNNGLNGLYPKNLSWTQIAISRCNEIC